MEPLGQHGHGHGRSTTHEDPPDDAANDATVHDDEASAAHSSAAYDAASAGPANGHAGNIGAVQHAHGKYDGTRVILTAMGRPTVYILTKHIVLHHTCTGRPPPQSKIQQNHPKASCQNMLTPAARHTACNVTLEFCHHEDSSPYIQRLTATDFSANSSASKQPHYTYYLPQECA